MKFDEQCKVIVETMMDIDNAMDLIYNVVLRFKSGGDNAN